MDTRRSLKRWQTRVVNNVRVFASMYQNTDKQGVLTAENRASATAIFTGYYGSVTRRLLREHKQLQKRERQNNLAVELKVNKCVRLLVHIFCLHRHCACLHMYT